MKVLLFSGGIDSTSLAYWKRPDQLLFIDYGQTSADGERLASEQISKDLGLPLDFKKADCRAFGSGELAGLINDGSRAPEFWPFRNQLLITLAAMAYSASSPLTIMVGTVATDNIHPDGRPEFLNRVQDLLNCQADHYVEAPAINMTSSELVQASQAPLSLLSWSFSCHRGGRACGQCRGCHKHFETLRQAFPDAA